MNDYQATREELHLHFAELVEQARRDAFAHSFCAQYIAAPTIYILGTPVLLPHGDGQREQKQIDRHLRAGQVAAARALRYAKRAESFAPVAPEKLQREIEDLAADLARMRAVNRAHTQFKKNPTSLELSELSEADQELVRSFDSRFEPHPFAAYQMSNNRAKQKRLRERIAELERDARRTPAPAGFWQAAFLAAQSPAGSASFAG